MTTTLNNFLDLRGMACPLPLMKTQTQLRKMNPGEQLTVYVTDPQARDDFEALSSARVITLLEVLTHEGYLQIDMQRT